ncbi:DUF4375 domain-containing protein [Polaribacter sp. BAL334]|uniref:DMP19 family protein n=1 Tax=Polaribacter sp. BAL334 TaxID=1708178 RepID=UPI0018D23645|nr:DUF4375 domain-containing protein [Polaribacter sp. BAL334]MBG7611604.1 DUF4375 domain-containing protein [Polaribacter sp. BAL334]
MTEIDFALQQKKDTEIIEFVGTVIWNKLNENKVFENLSFPERNFIYIDIFESEINHDGFYGFFYNTSGEFSHEVLEAFSTINAIENATIFYKAIRIFPEIPVPKDIILRRQIMGKLKDSDLEKWSDLELDLLNTGEDILGLMIDYIKENKTSFEY